MANPTWRVKVALQEDKDNESGTVTATWYKDIENETAQKFAYSETIVLNNHNGQEFVVRALAALEVASDKFGAEKNISSRIEEALNT